MKTPFVSRAARWSPLLGILVIPALLATARAEKPSPERLAMQAFMRQKLAASQGLLEGLTLERYPQVQKSALLLRKMSQTNAWSTSGNVMYREQMTNYQANLDALWAAAGEGNLDAASAAYGRVARNCVECHRVVRVDQHLRQVNTPGR